MKPNNNPTAALALACTLLFVACGQKNETFTDARDGKIYKTVKIGKQVWMAENLNYEADGSKCYNDSTAYCDKYGRLYNWETAMEACPKSWHLPDSLEWEVLVAAVAAAGGEKTLKTTKGWNENGNGEDKYGFSALPGGMGYPDGSFVYVGSYSGWWSSSMRKNSEDYFMDIYYNISAKLWISLDKSTLRSVRCIQDQ